MHRHEPFIANSPSSLLPLSVRNGMTPKDYHHTSRHLLECSIIRQSEIQWQIESEIAFIRNIEKKKHNFHVFLNVKHLMFYLFINH
jgi:hypothetical protein